MDISEQQMQLIRLVFEKDMLETFAKGVRAVLSVRMLDTGIGAPKGETHLRFGIALVCDGEVKEIICGKKTPESTRESFRNMVSLRLAGELSPEYDGLIYEYRKYESVRGLWEGGIVKLPKGLRGMIIYGKIYRVFVLVDSLAGCPYESLKEMAKPLIDQRLRDIQAKFEGNTLQELFATQAKLLGNQ